MKSSITKNKGWLLNRLHSIHRIILCMVIAVASYFLIPFPARNETAHVMLCWDIFAFLLLLLSWFTFFTTDNHHIREQAKAQDGSRVLIFITTLVCTFASLMAVIILLINKTEPETHKTLQLSIAILGMLLSWLLVHTIFAYRYAHIYYDDHKEKKGADAKGLEFPEEPNPDLLDFAYFSFVLGMTFQVSDVSITSSRIRQLALFQGLISFIYNTTLIALTINIVVSK